MLLSANKQSFDKLNNQTAETINYLKVVHNDIKEINNINYILKRIRAGTQTDICAPMFTEALFTLLNTW